jgi:hypothetical protein
MMFICVVGTAQKKWDGGGNTSAWEDSANWSPDGVPGALDHVILDHQWLQQDYLVQLPAGNTVTEILSVTLAPTNGLITLVLPASNTALPGLKLTATGDAMIIHDKGTIINASTAPSGAPLQLIGKMRINDGGKYIHRTVRGNAELIDRLSDGPGTGKGIFEFDVPGTAGYTVSLTGNSFGSLIINAAAAGGAKSYSGSGTSNLTIRGDLIVRAGASLTSTLTANVILGGDLVTEGRLNLHPVTAGTNGRSLIFNGGKTTFKGSGIFSTNAFFRDVLVSKSTELKLERPCALPFTPNTFICQGVLDCGQQHISGAGSFILADSATIITASDSGLSAAAASGNIRTTFRSLSSKAHYVFSGATHQNSEGIPDTVASLTVNNALHLVLSKSLVTDTLHLMKGKIMTDSIHLLRILGSIKGPSVGSLNPAWNSVFIDGPFYVQLNDTLLHVLPAGAGETFAPIQVRQMDSTHREVRVSFREGQAFSSLSPSLSAISSRGYWTFSPDQEGFWMFGLSYPLADSNLYPGMSVAPAALVDMNGVLKWRLLAGRTSPGDAQTGWLFTDTAVQEFSALSTGFTSNAGLLPLRLISLRSENQGSGIRLHWETDQDNLPASYTIERSRDGRKFSALAVIKAGSSGLSRHSWVDETPLEPVNYYRLFMEGQGAGKYSPIIRENYTRHRAKLYPNPVVDKIHIYFPDRSSSSYLDIVNSNGAVLRSHFVKTTNCILGVSDLPTGVYFLRFRGTKNPTTLQFTKY